MLDPFHYAFVQRGALELVLLAPAAGVLGTWIVLRGLAFYAHGVATAAFPGLVVAAGLGFGAPLGALAAAAAFTLGVERLAAPRREGHDVLTALVLVGALALGAILASDVFHSRSSVETLLFGSVLAVGTADLAFAAAAGALALALAALLGARWLVAGFDPGAARALGVRSALPDALLLAAVTLAVVSALAAVGALLAGALFVLPAATAGLRVRGLRRRQLASVALAAAEGVGGLWLSVEANVPPGAAIAVLAGAVFAVTAALRGAGRGLLPALGAAVAGLALALELAGCGGAGGGGGRPLVVATTTEVADWARAVGGGAVTVHGLLRPSTDPHEYEPRPDDVVATAGAAVVLVSGGGVDSWMGKVVSAAGGDPLLVDLGARVPVRRAGDPHWWHDPRNAEAAVGAIARALARADPPDRRVFARNARAYEARLRALDRRIAACFERVPPGERTLVTSHDAFGYFAARYRIRVVGAVVPSQTTQGQPSAGDVARLVATIRRERVRAVFPESSLNAALSRAIARETGATASYRLWGDTLGPPGSGAATYAAMELTNADRMVRGFTGGREGCR
ncbi:MAG TPA: zinc ABC transporter substrate-binding protein [Gaiellaceae bacterium]|nr:zinc ABC transporter substrate-binding protein [Gaiellaceae bacterium]